MRPDFVPKKRELVSIDFTEAEAHLAIRAIRGVRDFLPPEVVESYDSLYTRIRDNYEAWAARFTAENNLAIDSKVPLYQRFQLVKSLIGWSERPEAQELVIKVPMEQSDCRVLGRSLVQFALLNELTGTAQDIADKNLVGYIEDLVLEEPDPETDLEIFGDDVVTSLRDTLTERDQADAVLLRSMLRDLGACYPGSSSYN